MCLCTQGWKPELREKGDGVRERERERKRERERERRVSLYPGLEAGAQREG